jgi:hypothetical protein
VKLLLFSDSMSTCHICRGFFGCVAFSQVAIEDVARNHDLG